MSRYYQNMSDILRIRLLEEDLEIAKSTIADLERKLVDADDQHEKYVKAIYTSFGVTGVEH